MNWDGADYAAAAALVGGAGFAAYLLAGRGGDRAYRAGAGIALLAAVMLTYGNLAVGIVGAAGDAANLLFVGVVLVAVSGALLSRLKAGGMAPAMLATALSQAAAGAVALAGGLGTGGAAWPLDVLGATVFFGALWLVSAWLFRRAGRRVAVS